MKLPIISGLEVIKRLKKAGFIATRQKGSHVRLEKFTIEKTIKNNSIQKRFGAFFGKVTVKNSDNFVFDTEFLAEAAANKFRVGEIAIPCRYFSEASSVNFVNSTIYGLQTLAVCWRYLVDKSSYKN